MITLYSIVLLSIFLGGSLLWAETGKQHLRGKTWEEILTSLRPVQIEWIAVIALNCREGSEFEERLLDDNLWKMLGGWRGVRAILSNADSLSALAAYAHLGEYRASAGMAELMTVQATLLRSAVLQALWRHILGFRPHAYRSALREVAVLYYDMTEALLESYEGGSRRAYVQLCVNLRPYLTPQHPFISR